MKKYNTLHELKNVFTELLCPYPPSAANTQLSIEGQAPGEYVIYRCNIGYYFPNGGTMRSMKCLTNFKWSASVPGCQGNDYLICLSELYCLVLLL